ncbi:MAG: hypothetical protein R6U26_00730 [Candidatus Undinarchaeales archaeon]
MKLKISFHNDKTIPVFLRTIANWTAYTDVIFKKNGEQEGYSFLIELDTTKVKGFKAYLKMFKSKGIKIETS